MTRWRAIAFGLMGTLAIGLFTFLAVTRLVQVDDNTSNIRYNCERRNEQMEKVNQKFEQLGRVFDLSIAQRPPTAPPLDSKILRLYAEFRQPIPLTVCNRPSSR